MVLLMDPGNHWGTLKGSSCCILSNRNSPSPTPPKTINLQTNLERLFVEVKFGPDDAPGQKRGSRLSGAGCVSSDRVVAGTPAG